MNKKIGCFFILLAAINVAAAKLENLQIEQIEIIEGFSQAISGDILKFNDILIHLSGIDAPGVDETCSVSVDSWPCGHSSKNLLAFLIKDEKVFCEIDTQSVAEGGMHYAVCSTDKIKDLGAYIVASGLAFAFDYVDFKYAKEERDARADGLGLWASNSSHDDWRLNHNDEF